MVLAELPRSPCLSSSPSPSPPPQPPLSDTLRKGDKTGKEGEGEVIWRAAPHSIERMTKWLANRMWCTASITGIFPKNLSTLGRNAGDSLATQSLSTIGSIGTGNTSSGKLYAITCCNFSITSARPANCCEICNTKCYEWVSIVSILYIIMFGAVAPKHNMFHSNWVRPVFFSSFSFSFSFSSSMSRSLDKVVHYAIKYLSYLCILKKLKC